MKQFSRILVILLLVLSLAGAGCMTTQPPTSTPTATTTSTPPPSPPITLEPTPPVNLSADEQRVFAFVTEAVAFAREQGREKALSDFNNPNGSFVRDDLYIFAADYNGRSLASIALPERVNTSFYNETDMTGQYYMRNKINLSRSGGGFIIIHFPNPAHGMAVEPKLCYVHDVDGTFWIGAGVHNQTKTTA